MLSKFKPFLNVYKWYIVKPMPIEDIAMAIKNISSSKLVTNLNRLGYCSIMTEWNTLRPSYPEDCCDECAYD